MKRRAMMCRMCGGQIYWHDRKPFNVDGDEAHRCMGLGTARAKPAPKQVEIPDAGLTFKELAAIHAMQSLIVVYGQKNGGIDGNDFYDLSVKAWECAESLWREHC